MCRRRPLGAGGQVLDAAGLRRGERGWRHQGVGRGRPRRSSPTTGTAGPRAREDPRRRRSRDARAWPTTVGSPASSTSSSGCEFDSLWVSERVTGGAPDPVVAMAFAAGAPTQLKFGMSVMVLPGRNPVAAREGARQPRPPVERAAAPGVRARRRRPRRAAGVRRGPRGAGAWFDEALPLLRRFWTEDVVDHDGARFRYEGMRAAEAGRSSRPTSGSAAGRPASCAASGGSATAGCRASDTGPGRGRPRHRGGGGRRRRPRDRRRALGRARRLRARRRAARARVPRTPARPATRRRRARRGHPRRPHGAAGPPRARSSSVGFSKLVVVPAGRPAVVDRRARRPRRPPGDPTHKLRDRGVLRGLAPCRGPSPAPKRVRSAAGGDDDGAGQRGRAVGVEGGPHAQHLGRRLP